MSAPMAEFLSRLLSLGHTGQELEEIVRLAEEAFRPIAKSSSFIEEKREKERLRKADYRSRVSQKMTGHVPSTLLSLEDTNTMYSNKKERKKETPCPNVPRDKTGQDDGWPDDALEQFWKVFPSYRKQAKAKVGEKLARIRRDSKVTWPVLFEGAQKFAATNPGEFAPAPMVWLNEGRWDREYGGINGNAVNGHRTYSAAQPRQTRDDAILAGMGRVARRYVKTEQPARSDDGPTFEFVDVTPKPDPNR